MHPIIHPAYDNNCPLQNDGANTAPCLLVSSILLVDSNVSSFRRFFIKYCNPGIRYVLDLCWLPSCGAAALPPHGPPEVHDDLKQLKDRDHRKADPQTKLAPYWRHEIHQLEQWREMETYPVWYM